MNDKPNIENHTWQDFTQVNNEGRFSLARVLQSPNGMDITIPLVTITTLTYKKFKYLYQALDSIFIQDYPNIEMIICDDGSDNYPHAEIEKYILEHANPNIRRIILLRNHTNLGTVKNSNGCRKIASGKYILSLASDDYYYDERVIGDVVDFFEKTGADVITCKEQFIRATDGRKMFLFPTEKMCRWIENCTPEGLYHKMICEGFISGAATYLRRSFFQEMGCYDERCKYVEDYPFYLKILRNGHRIHLLNRTAICYRFGDGVSTQHASSNDFRSTIFADRVCYWKQEVMPYVGSLPWQIRHLVKCKMERFKCGEKVTTKDKIRIMMKNPIGTVVFGYYANQYKARVRGANK